MRFLRRSRATAPQAVTLAAHLDAMQRLRDQVAAERTRRETEQADLVDRLTSRYYALSAMVEDDFARGITAGRSDRIGMMTGLRDALAEATGIDEITVDFRLSHGIPVTANWTAVNDAPDSANPDIRLLHDNVRESAAERLDTLRRTALKKYRPDLYPLIYGDTATLATAGK